MAAPPLVFDFIGVVFTAILYGFYCLLLGVYWRIQLRVRRADRWNRLPNSAIFYALTVNFILCTAYLIITIIQVQLLITGTVLKDNSYVPAYDWMIIAVDLLYTGIDFISQLVLLYRCWIMWRQPLVMVIPCILSLSFLVIALATVGVNIKYILINMDDDPPPSFYSTVTAFFFISLGVNALATALIVYKIIIIYIETHELNGQTRGNEHPDLSALVSILIESGLITFAGQLTQSIMYKFATDAFPLVGGSVVMLYGISMTAVFVRVMMGISYDNNTTRTVISMDSGDQIPLTPYASKFNPSQTTKVGRSGSSASELRAFTGKKLMHPNFQ